MPRTTSKPRSDPVNALTLHLLQQAARLVAQQLGRDLEDHTCDDSGSCDLCCLEEVAKEAVWAIDSSAAEGHLIGRDGLDEKIPRLVEIARSMASAEQGDSPAVVVNDR